MIPRLTFDRLRSQNAERCKETFHPIDAWSGSDWGNAMAGECGEACNIVKKLRRLDGADSHLDTPGARAALIEKLATELADLVIYADLLAARFNISLSDAVRDKFNLVSTERKSCYYL